MKKIYGIILLAAFSSQIVLAQQAAKATSPEFQAYQKKRLKETDEQHRMVKTYFSNANFEEMFERAANMAKVSSTDRKGYHEMISEKYFYKDKFAILEKINRNELNDANVAAYKQGVVNEYASYYQGAYLQGKTTLLGENAPKVKNSSGKEIEAYLSSRLGTNVTLVNNCGNSDFETGSFSGWFGANYAVSSAFGCGAGTPNPMPNAGFNFTALNTPLNEHGLCTTAGGNDPSVTAAALPCVSPFNGGTYSCRLGDVNDGCGAAQMSFSFTVNSSNTNFTYSYAAVLYDGHVAADAPKIIFDMIDLTTGQPIACAHYYIDATQAGVAGSGYLPAFVGSTSLYYKPWSLVFVPLTGYIGKNVQMNVETTDCDGGAHRGYSYFDASCAPFQLSFANNPCGGGNAIIVAPGGAATYSWSTSGGGTIVGSTSSQSVTASTSGTYSVTMTSFGSGCAYTLDTTIIISVAPAPIASFSATTVCIGSATQFTDSSYVTGGPPINGWSWDFGDGGTSGIQNPNHTYATAGTFVATLTVSVGACTDTYTLNVVVNTTITPTFSAPPVCFGSPTVFTNTTLGASTYSWTFGDGNSSNIAAPSNTYSASGTYVVSLTVTTASGCIGAGTNNVIVKPIPTLNPMPNIGVCDQSQVVVGAWVSVPVGATVAWTNNNTSIGLVGAGNGNIAPFTGQSNGSPTPVTGTVTAIPTLNGCVGPPITFEISISPQPTITLVSPAPYCPGDVVPSPVIVSNPVGATFVWINSNTQIGLGANGIGIPPQFNATPNPNFTLNNVLGVITVTPAIGTCIGQPASYTVTVKPTPVVIPPPDVEYCPNVNTLAVNFTANPGGGAPTFFWTATNTAVGLGAASGTGSLPSYLTINGGNSLVTTQILVSASLNGCPGPTTPFNMTVNPNPTALFKANNGICEGSPMSFTDQSSVGTSNVTQWGWDFNFDGVYTDATSQNPQYIFTAGSHTVGLMVTTNKGCTSLVIEPIYVNYNPVPQFIGDVLVGCPIHPVNFTESATVVPPAQVVSWNWNFGNGTTSNVQTPGTVFYNNTSPVTSAFYTVSLVVATDSGCVGSLIKNNYITVYPTPIANFAWGPHGPEPDIMEPTVFFQDQSIGASGPNSYGPNGMLWNLGDVFLNPQINNYVNNVQNPVHTYDYELPYTYFVTQWVQNIYGCKDSITKPVEIQPNWTFYIPNAFSPNGDGVNEGFKGQGIGIDNTTYNLWVFDRWGNQCFYTNDINTTWNGKITTKGDIVQEDVYVWKVKFHDYTGRKHEFKGTVSLIK